MTITGSPHAFARTHLCELLLFAFLATPVLMIAPTPPNFLIVTVVLLALAVLGMASDIPTRLSMDDDGLVYLDGGRDRRFIAWNEIGCIVPRSFRGWPAENAFVALDHDRRPLLVATVSMMRPEHIEEALRLARAHVPVEDRVVLSPMTGRADGHRRPELAPQRTTERFLAQVVMALVVVSLGAAIIFFALKF